MAKYIIGSNGNQTVNCEILNENAGRYIVRFKSGVIKDVDKNKVTSLDKIDESVLELVNEGKLGDIVKGAANGLGSFGKKIGGAVKAAFDYVISRIIKAKNRIWFQQENGEIARAVHPVNGMLAAAENDAIGFIPSEDIVNFADDLGVTARSFEPKVSDYAYSGSAIYCRPEFDENGTRLNESQENIKSGKIYGSEKEDVIQLDDNKFIDLNTKELVEELSDKYEERIDDIVERESPLFIWGAPGIGKTSIIKAVAKAHENVPVLTVMASNIEPEAFTMPANVSKKRKKELIAAYKDSFRAAMAHGDDNEDNIVGAMGDQIIKDLPKSWMPVYEYDPELSEDELNQRIYLANGAIPNEDGICEEDGKGGFFFIDEFVRMSPAGMYSIFDMPLSRQLGVNSSLRLGTRWTVVCASNRYSDITSKGAGSLRLIGFDAAAAGRFLMVNFVPEYNEWKAWASEYSEKIPECRKVNRNFIEFIDVNPDSYYALAKQEASRPQDLDCSLVQACPRRWEQLSQEIRTKIYKRILKSGNVVQGKDCDDYIFDLLSEPLTSKIIRGYLGKELGDKLIDYLTMKMNGLSFTDLKEMIEKGDTYTPRQEVADKFTTAFYTSKQAIEEYFSNVSLNSALQNLLNGFGDYIPTDGLAKLIYAFGKLIDKTKGNQQGGDKAQTFLDCLTQRCGYAKPSEVKTADEEMHLVRTAIAKVFGVSTAKTWLG